MRPQLRYVCLKAKGRWDVCNFLYVKITDANVTKWQTTGSTVASTDSTSSPTTTSSSDESSSGTLSAGASAGIGVGAAAAAILLAVIGWLLYRRRKKNARLRAEPPNVGPMHQEDGYGYYKHGSTDPNKSHTQSLRSELPPSGPQRSELAGQAPVELGT